MAKLRFLQSVALLSLNKVPHLNDELVIEDEKMVKYLVENGYADELIEQENEPKTPKNAPKKAKKAVEKDA
ncbi:hypothetical protein ABFY54_29000 [Priestia megaterium]|uniref:hypothetical protein n=1 Tax=Priestia megaterium TaxID=1404 RepID=UPI003D2DFD2F